MRIHLAPNGTGTIIIKLPMARLLASADHQHPRCWLTDLGPWKMISTTRSISVWEKERKWKYIFHISYNKYSTTKLNNFPPHHTNSFPVLSTIHIPYSIKHKYNYVASDIYSGPASHLGPHLLGRYRLIGVRILIVNLRRSAERLKSLRH